VYCKLLLRNAFFFASYFEDFRNLNNILLHDKQLLYKKLPIKKRDFYAHLCKSIFRVRSCGNQCCGSMTFWGGSGSMPLTNGFGSGSGSWFRILIFSSLTYKMPAKNKFFDKIFSAYYFLKLHLHHFSKIKSQKGS
jgi:hypothetical protein